MEFKLETTETTVPLRKFKIVAKSIKVENYIVKAETEDDACNLVSMGDVNPVYEKEIEFDIDDVKEIIHSNDIFDKI